MPACTNPTTNPIASTATPTASKTFATSSIVSLNVMGADDNAHAAHGFAFGRSGHRHQVPDALVKRADRSVLRDPTRRGAVLALAAVLALDGADRTALGALTPALKTEFGVGNGAIGILAGAFAIVGALATVPIGILTDRVRRITILVVCIGIWCVGMGVAAAAVTFAVLFVARIALGVLSAAGEPPVSSIVGDLFPADVRGRVLGMIESGALV